MIYGPEGPVYHTVIFFDEDAPMFKKVLAVIVGFLAWWIIAGVLVGGLLPAVWSEYQIANEIKIADGVQSFSVLMLLTRLFLSAIANVFSGFITVYISKQQITAWYTASALVVIMIYSHIALFWNDWPVWYHLGFLIPFVPIVIAGGKLAKTQNGKYRKI